MKMIKILFLHSSAFIYQTQRLIEQINLTRDMNATLCTSWNNDKLHELIPHDITILITIHSRKSILEDIYNYCKKCNIIMIILQDGIIDYKHWNIVVPDRYNPLLSDYIFVFGRTSQQLLVNRGIAREKIIITGCPRFDTYFSKESTQGDYVLITCANTPYHTLKEKIVLWMQLLYLISFCKVNQYPFRIRFSESVKKKNIFRFLLFFENKNNVNSVSLKEEINGARLVCTTMSTLVLESLCLQKPVMLIKNHTYPYYIQTTFELKKIFSKLPFKSLDEITFSKKDQKLLNDNISYQGCSTMRVIASLYKIGKEI